MSQFDLTELSFLLVRKSFTGKDVEVSLELRKSKTPEPAYIILEPRASEKEQPIPRDCQAWEK